MGEEAADTVAEAACKFVQVSLLQPRQFVMHIPSLGQQKAQQQQQRCSPAFIGAHACTCHCASCSSSECMHHLW
jgi:hypothetical protein